MKTNLLPALILSLLFLSLSASSCEGKKESNTETETAAEPATKSPFSSDSALLHIRRQVDFGPRVPNSPAHQATRDYLVDCLNRYGLAVRTQEMTLTAYDGTKLDATNIIASHNPEAERRVLLFAHWDTRPFADHDPDTKRRHDPIDGADDGASGVGVLLEIARLLQAQPLKEIGVDIALFDAEDYGAPSGYEGDSEKTWALGTQYWTEHPVPEGYRAEFGILLDMVGAKNATFYREYYSQEAAGRFVTMIWDKARDLGHGKFFPNAMGGAVTDDHTFVIRNLRIPSVDIINYDPRSENGFGTYWHTHRDTIENISTETLQAVGDTVWAVLVDYDGNNE